MTDRRQFCKSAPIAAAVIASHVPTFIDELPIVDAHQHLWDLRRFRLDWISRGSPLDHRFLHSEYAVATAGLNVVEAVYVEVAVDASQHQAEAEAVAEWCRTRAGVTTAGVISGRPERDDFKTYIQGFRNSPYIKGVRRLLQGPDTPAGHADHATFVRNIQLLGELGMSFDICIPGSRLDEAIALVDACPGTQFILDHCGCPDLTKDETHYWRGRLAAIAKRNHVACKVSGIVTACKPKQWTVEQLAPVVNHVLDSFGPDRVMFASDWPVCTLAASFAEWLGCLKQIVAQRGLQERRKLFADNARRVYRLNHQPKAASL